MEKIESELRKGKEGKGKKRGRGKEKGKKRKHVNGKKE